MSFNPSNIIYESYPALEVGTGPIVMDGSAVSEVVYQYQTNTAPALHGVGEPLTYNGVETLFDVRIPSTARVLFEKSYLRITGKAANMAVGENSPVLVGTSIPWNTIAATLETAELQLNQSATTTEQINQNLGDGSMVKMLTRYSRSAIESMDDAFFTPCFEETRDKIGPALGTTYLSQVSQARRDTQLTDNPGNGQRLHSKAIYLPDLFDSLALPAAFYVQNLQIKIRPKLAGDILIKDTGCLGVNAPLQKYFITNIALYLTMVNLTEQQLVKERDKILSNSAILRQAFYSYDALQKSHTQGASYRDSNVKNMQAAVFMIPSLGAGDGIGCNRYQYCYGCSAANPGMSGISSYQMKYDGVYSPATPLQVSNSDHGTNIDLFAQYRLLCKKMYDREIEAALRFSNYAPPRPAVYDESTYVLFCAQFYPQDAFGHKQMSGADHEIQTGGGTTESLIVVRIRLSFLEIRGDTSVYMIN